MALTQLSSFRNTVSLLCSSVFILNLFLNEIKCQSLSFSLDAKFKHGDPKEFIKNLSKSPLLKVSPVNLTADEEIEKDIMNYNDAQYYSTLYLGNDYEEFTFIFDTGSEWLWIPSDSCVNCRSEAKKYSPSSSFEDLGYDNTITYVSASVKGRVGQDKVWPVVVTGSDVKMKMMLVTSEQGTSGTKPDGIVGLTPSSHNGADLLVAKLYESKLIGNQTFGLNINSAPTLSKLILGGDDRTIVGENPNYAWLKLKGDQDWRVDLKKIKYNNETIYATGGIAVFDCGTSITTFQTSIYFNILRQIVNKAECFEIDTGYYTSLYGCHCDSYNDFDNITLQLNDYEFNWTPKQYIIETDIQGANTCVMMFNGKALGTNQDFILLGANFFYNYYVYHDMGGKRIGLYGDFQKAPDSAYSMFSTVTLISVLSFFTMLMIV